MAKWQGVFSKFVPWEVALWSSYRKDLQGGHEVRVSVAGTVSFSSVIFMSNHSLDLKDDIGLSTNLACVCSMVEQGPD